MGMIHRYDAGIRWGLAKGFAQLADGLVTLLSVGLLASEFFIEVALRQLQRECEKAEAAEAAKENHK